MAVDGRRLVRASLVACLAFLCVGAGTGFAVAAAEDGGPRELVVPLPRPGDRASYQVTHEALPGVRPAVDDVFLAEVVHEWLPERTVLDRAFAQRISHPLQSTYVYRLGGDEGRAVVVTDFDAVTGEPFHAFTSGRSTMGSPLLAGTGPGQGIGALAVPPDDVHYAYDFYADGMTVPCAMRSLLQGAAAVPAGLRLDGCGWADAADPTYAPAGWEDLADGDAFRFDATGSPSLQAWFETGSPFPVRFTAAMREAVGTASSVGRVFTLERTAWAPGAAAYPVHGTASLADPRPIAAVPRLDPTVLDDAALAHEFSLAVAYAAAEAAPRAQQGTGLFGSSGAPPGPTYKEWSAEHPDAYLAEALRFKDVNAYFQSYDRWTFVWVDGDAWLGKLVADAPQSGGDAGLPNAHLPQPAPRRITVTDWTPRSTPEAMADYIDSFPARADLPAVVPSVPDLADRFLEVTRPGTQDTRANVTYYGFRFTCEGADPACATAGVSMFAGEASYEVDAMGGLVGARIMYDSLSVDGEGLAVSQAYQVSDTQTVLGLGAPTKEETPPPPAPQASRAWVLPSTPASATGISLLAVAAAALYYFWPALKGLPAAGLFSRVEGRAVLDHPTRRRVYDAIQAEPGIHFMALARKAGVGRGALDHHLRKLAAADLLTVRRAPGYTCYFAKGTLARQLVEAAPVLRSGGSRAVFDAIQAEPGLSGRELARRLGRSPSTVNYHLQRLQEAGLVFGEGAGMRLSPLGEQAAVAA